MKEFKTFLLIHGAYHGAWCWDVIKEALISKGHIVYAINLPGHGTDKTPKDSITLDTYVNSVVNFIFENNLSEITIVGHSFGGVVISNVVERIPDKIKNAVFVTAMILDNRKKFFDYLPKEVEKAYQNQALLSGDNTILPNKEAFKLKLANECINQDAFEQFFSKLGAQPIQPYKENVSLKDISLPKETFDEIVELVPDNSHIVELDADHEVFLSNPLGLVRILDNI